MTAADDWAAANWDRLIAHRADALHQFLSWAARTEAAGGDRNRSLRLAARDDLAAVRSVIDLFPHRWWGICVYSAVDRAQGARMLAEFVPVPVPVDEADKVVPVAASWPWRTIGGHRGQRGNSGARRCLLSLCTHRDTIREILTDGTGFDMMVEGLLGLNAEGVGRTTAFDLALRAGQLLHDPPIAPTSAHLLGSTGPAAGFRLVWGFDPAREREQADRAEAILRLWTRNWYDVADLVGVGWRCSPFSAVTSRTVCAYTKIVGSTTDSGRREAGYGTIGTHSTTGRVGGGGAPKSSYSNLDRRGHGRGSRS